MTASDKEWYQQNFDKLLQPELWSVPRSNDTNQETPVTKRLSAVAREFFEGNGVTHPQENPSSEERSGNDPLYQFIELGEKNAWIEPEKIERIHRFAQDNGLIPLFDVEAQHRSPLSPLGNLIEQVYQKTHELQSHQGILADREEEIPKSPTAQTVQLVENSPIYQQEDKQVLKQRYIDEIKAFISDGLDINRLDEYGRGAIMRAAQVDSPEGIRLLLEAGANINLVDKYERTALHHAAVFNHLDCVKILCDADVDINRLDDQKCAALHYAVKYGNLECVKALCTAGADVNVLDGEGLTALHYAASCLRHDYIKPLCEAGADINVLDGKGVTALHYAVYRGSRECILQLSNVGADLNLQDEHGRTALHWAVALNKSECVQQLCNAGADLNLNDRIGRKVLHLAVDLGNLECVRQLFNAGADINVLDGKGVTALHWAVYRGNLECVKLLLALGANPLIEDKRGFNALSCAILLRTEHFKEIKLLLEQSTEALQSSKKTLKERFLGHVAHLDDRSERWSLSERSLIQGKLATERGNFPPHIFTKIRKSLREFSREFPTMLTDDMCDMIQITTASNCLYKQSADDLMKRWESYEPILINSGFRGHYLSILIWKDRFVICNRGGGASLVEYIWGKTLKVFSYDSSKLTKEIIQKIISAYEGDIKSYLKLIETELPQLLGFTHSAVDEKIESARLPMQITGNCSYANAEGGILALMVLSKLYQLSPELDLLEGVQIDEVVNEQKLAFTNWQASLLIHALQKYLKWVKDPRNCFIPNFYLVKGAFNRFAATHSVLPQLKVKAKELEDEWNQVEKEIPPPSSLEKAYYYFGIGTLVKMMPQ